MTRAIELVVGCPDATETVTTRYLHDAKSVIDDCRQVLDQDVIFTFRQTIVRAFMYLHRNREVDVTIIHDPSGNTIELDLDGCAIQPWPDGLFEVDFHILFANPGELDDA